MARSVPDDLLPAVRVEPARRRPPPPPVTVVEPPFSRQVALIAGALRRMRHRYAIVIGNNRQADPRLRSVVEHRVPSPAVDVTGALHRECGIAFIYDPVNREYRSRTQLALPWSWPRLPMWLAVGELSATQSALRLSLRTRRRLRYPARYFHAAHAALDELAAALGVDR